MESIKQIYRMGHGPSSSRAMGPIRAVQIFLERNRDAVRFNVTSYGSLAATGKGRVMDATTLEISQPVTKINTTWEPKTFSPLHPNGVLLEPYSESGEGLDTWTVYSIGGRTLANESFNGLRTGQTYNMHMIKEIQAWYEKTGYSYQEHAEQYEGPSIWDYLAEAWEVMQDAVRRNLETEGTLSGDLGIRRKVSDYTIRVRGYGSSVKDRGMAYACALAVSEESARGGKIMTAPTYGSYGVMPAVPYHLKETCEFRGSRILRALAIAGLFENVVYTNTSVSRAEVGCQDEVDAARAMAATTAGQLFGGTPVQIEYVAEMGLEHRLELTCSPVCGLVQIPRIERDAFAATRTPDMNTFSDFSDERYRVSFNRMVGMIRQTGNSLPSLYKETSEDGLVKNMENSSN